MEEGRRGNGEGREKEKRVVSADPRSPLRGAGGEDGDDEACWRRDGRKEMDGTEKACSTRWKERDGRGG